MQLLFAYQGVQHIFDGAFRTFNGRFRNFEKQCCLAVNSFEVFHQRLNDFAFGTNADAMNNLNEQVYETVDDFLPTLPTEGCNEGIANLFWMAT